MQMLMHKQSCSWSMYNPVRIKETLILMVTVSMMEVAMTQTLLAMQDPMQYRQHQGHFEPQLLPTLLR